MAEEDEDEGEADEEGKEFRKSKLVSKFRENPYLVSTIVFGLACIILLFLVLKPGVTGGITGKVISRNEAGQKVIDFAKTQGMDAALIKVNDAGSFYEVVISLEGQEMSVYVTKDGENLISGLIPLTGQAVQPTQEIETNDVSIDDDAIKGDINAKVTIVEFSDYECPFCGRHYTQTLPQIISEYVETGKVKLVFRDFPLSFHENAQKAAEAAECAGLEGDDKYWEMHDKLFQNQEALDIASLKRYAKELGINSAEFDKCLDSGEMEKEVNEDFEDGQSYGVSGTPAFFINGRKLSGAQPFSAFKEVIDEELSK